LSSERIYGARRVNGFRLPVWAAGALLVSCWLRGGTLWGQGVNVSLHVQVERMEGGRSATSPGKRGVSSANVVVWLTPEGGEGGAAAAPRPQQSYRMVQKDKQFIPHMLVVPTGTSVEFPNQDPFFHNVFSLFNGKRFDLGLYEAGSHRSVRFDREGVSYIFCNIHPQMGAVIVSLSTPYYAVSTAEGGVTLRRVPAGMYRLHLWAEDVMPASSQMAEREVLVESTDVQLGEASLQATNDAMAGHKNKFGDDYKSEPAKPY
jgi:plastocyanin